MKPLKLFMKKLIYVCKDITKQSSKESNTGKNVISSSNMVVDLNDYIAKKDSKRCEYTSATGYKPMNGKFTIALNDILIWKDREFTVKNINEIAPLSDKVEFLEVILNG